MSPSVVEVHDDAEALATSVAGALLSRLAAAQESGGEPHVALTGGSMAEAVHREIARLSSDSGVDWSRVVIWWGDERFVPSGSPDRNAGRARSDFLHAVVARQVHEMPSSDDAVDAESAAAAYGETMREQGGGEFEVVMLGLGPDGHVASLFPGHPALDVDDRVAVAIHDSPKPPPQRISLTFGALNRTRSVWIVASGESKAEAVAAVLGDETSDLPAARVAGREDTVWFLDVAAASHL